MKNKLALLTLCSGLLLSGNAMAQTELEALRLEVDALNKKAQEWEAYKAPKKKLQKDVSFLSDKAREWEEWKAPKTLVHLAGFADVGYAQSQNQTGSFNIGSFSPIFHYQFGDKFMLEAELDFDIDEAGKSEAGVDYLTIDWFVNDYMALVMGKFLSPLGQFRQNLHPSWINKVASAPVGFGHDQAAPNADVGLMARGGYLLASGNSLNYSTYLANGPTLEADGSEIDMIETPGLGVDGDGKKTVGGRFGMFFPLEKFEFGVSLATGKTAIRSGVAGSYSYDASRTYDVAGADFTWRPANFDVRGEYIQQKIGAQSLSVATEAGTWKAWYLQTAYRFSESSWEAVIRYSRYDTPADSTDVTQTALSANYLFASNLIGKISYEFNDNPNSGLIASDRQLVQLAYGF